MPISAAEGVAGLLKLFRWPEGVALLLSFCRWYVGPVPLNSKDGMPLRLVKVDVRLPLPPDGGRCVGLIEDPRTSSPFIPSIQAAFRGIPFSVTEGWGGVDIYILNSQEAVDFAVLGLVPVQGVVGRDKSIGCNGERRQSDVI
ncbi:hypothetical protein RRF57_009749 [Xylaria bambusicola]|uniref:Uncharacterized protein n=1 Tax=Xylaria bambusicola TaxID=326684 RepID=A0AAN7UK50_9PEZI